MVLFPVAAQWKWADPAGGAAKLGTLDTLFSFSCLESSISVSVLRLNLSEQTPLTTDQNWGIKGFYTQEGLASCSLEKLQILCAQGSS